MIRTIWYHASAFVRILEIEWWVLWIKAPTVWVQWLDWMVDYTLRLVPHIHYFCHAGGKAIFYACNRHVRAFFFIIVFSLCAGLTASATLVILAGNSPRKGEQELNHTEEGFLLFCPTQVVSKGTWGSVLQEHCWNMLWFSSGSVSFVSKEGGNRELNSLVHAQF